MSKKDLPWREAIVKVLEGADGAMHYKDIASAIVEQGLRQNNIGATPANTVSTAITTDINRNEAQALFERASPGYYLLKKDDHGQSRSNPKKSTPPTSDSEQAEEEAGIIRAFGMYWRRDLIAWNKPKILGQQTHKAKRVDFSPQIGVYLLHDGRDVVYAGRSADTLGQRLSAHTRDRLNGRWDRFSWFGFLSVNDNGELLRKEISATTEVLLATLEALLIEALEPPQNRRGGDGFRAVEYLQVEDPEFKRRREDAILRRLLDSRGSR
jgi:hypothetical protein